MRDIVFRESCSDSDTNSAPAVRSTTPGPSTTRSRAPSCNSPPSSGATGRNLSRVAA